MLKKALIFLIVGALAASAAEVAVAASKKGRAHLEKRGGYSYDYADSVNTYGDSRTKYGSASVYRDPNLDKQTNSGPFDHGFFFNSGVSGPHGGDSPYMN